MLSSRKNKWGDDKNSEEEHLMGPNIEPTSGSTIRNYFTLAMGSQLVGLIMIVLTISWISKHLGGFGWSNLKFNFHVLSMITGMVFFYGNAILIYRVLRKERKLKLKLFHASLNALALILALFGLYCVYQSHEDTKTPNYYSLHSWMGLITMVLFSSQYIVAFITYLYPGLTEKNRKLIMPFHVFLGIAVFALAIACCMSGLTEKALFSLPFKTVNNTPNPESYSQLPPAAMNLNFLGIFILLYGFLVSFLVTRPEFKRRPLPNESFNHFPLTTTD